MGFFADLLGNADPLLMGGLFGVGGGGNKAANIIGNPLGQLSGGGSNPLSGITGIMGGASSMLGGLGGMFGGMGGTGGGSSGVDVSGNASGGGGQVLGGTVSGSQRLGGTGTPTYPTTYGNSNSSYPIGFLGALTGQEAVFGRKPDYPLAPTPTELLQSNLYANLYNQPQAQQFAGNTNQFNLGQLTGLYDQTTPGLGTARTQSLTNINDRLAGRLPQADVDAIQRQGAAWGLTSGTGRPQAGNQAGNRTLRDLGLTTYAEQQKAGKDLENFISSTRRDILPPLSDPNQFTLQPSYDPYAEDKRLTDIAKIMAAPVPSAAGAAAAQQALLEGLLAVYSGSGKSGSTDPRSYQTQWPSSYGSSDGAGSGEGNSYNSGYLPDYSSASGGGGNLDKLIALFG